MKATTVPLYFFSVLLMYFWQINDDDDWILACSIVATVVYYGLLLSAGQLAGNLYINNFISGFVEIPAYTSAFFVSQKWAMYYLLV